MLLCCFKKKLNNYDSMDILKNSMLSTESLNYPQRPRDENVLNSLFEDLIVDLGFEANCREQLLKLAPDKKWQIYCSKLREDKKLSNVSVDVYVDKIKSLSNLLADSLNLKSQSEYNDLLLNLLINLRTQPISFIHRFIELGGLQCLIDILQLLDITCRQWKLHTTVIDCFKATMNNRQGREYILRHPNSINVLIMSLHCDNLKTKITILEILGALCLIPGGHKKVLNAAFYFQKQTGERTRFQHLILDLYKHYSDYKEEVNLKTAIMSFFNAILNCGSGEDHIEFRLHLRYELLMLGIQQIIFRLRQLQNDTLNRHLDFFEMKRNDDEKELAVTLKEVQINTRSATEMFEVLQRKVGYLSVYPHLASILHHLLVMQDSNESSRAKWQLIDYMIQQISIQQHGGYDPDVSVVNLDVKSAIDQIELENSISNLQNSLESSTKTINELKSRLIHKDRECELMKHEKEEAQLRMRYLNEKLYLEKQTNIDLNEHFQKAKDNVAFFERKFLEEQDKRESLEETIKSSSVHSIDKLNCVSVISSSDVLSSSYSGSKTRSQSHLTNSTESNQCLNHSKNISKPFESAPFTTKHHTAKENQSSVISDIDTEQNSVSLHSSMSTVPGPPPIPPPPPPPPMSSDRIPPPPAIGPPPVPNLHSGRLPSFSQVKKDIPQPSQPLKSFNWSKLPNSKIAGTVWNEMDDTKLFQKLNLQRFERMFSAYQKKNSNEDTSSTYKFASRKNRLKELSVIESRRAQNCTIVLSKFKMTNEEIGRLILNVDQDDQVDGDLLEQLLKFIPSREEAQMLQKHESHIDEMARADHFLLIVSKISHYEQRLKALCLKKKFATRLSELKSQIDDVLIASQEIMKSQKLRKVLEIILAFGNYMNQGHRGNAFGFRLSSLGKMLDTKSSLDKNITLLYYIMETLLEKFCDLSDLPDELVNVKHAAKVDLKYINDELVTLRKGLRDIEKELDFHVSNVKDKGDKFVEVMTDFETMANGQLTNAEDHYTYTNEQYIKAQKMFGEDGSVCPGEFFSIFSSFLTSFSEAKFECEQKKDKDVHITEHPESGKSSKKYSVNPPISSNVKSNKSSDSGDFDELISALRNADVFDDDLVSLKRTRKRGLKSEFTRERYGSSQVP